MGAGGACDDGDVQTNLVTLADIQKAREVLGDVIRLTPMEPCRPLAGLVGGPVWMKCENLQRAGAYKVRGALVRISGLSPAERARGVVAASAGNHAQGVAVAADLCHTSATVFMPSPRAISTTERTSTLSVALAGRLCTNSPWIFR